jgi:hypothetical protein
MKTRISRSVGQLQGSLLLVGSDVAIGLGLTLLAWLGLLVTVLRGRANIEQRAHAVAAGDDHDRDER